MANFFLKIAQIMEKSFGFGVAFIILIVAAWGVATDAMKDVAILMTELIQGNFGATAPQYAVLGEYASIANHVFPLTETISFSTIYFSFYTLMLTIRWIKSFIPTLAG